MKTTFILGLVCSIILCCTIQVSADPSVLISSYSLSPEVLFPGDVAELTLTLTNGEAANTVSTVSTSGSTTTTRTDSISATIDKVWIIADDDGNKDVKGSASYTNLGDLAPGVSTELTFRVTAENGISEGWYFPKVAVDVESYEDVRYPIPVKVSNETVDLLLTNVPSKLSLSGSTQITLTVVNTREASVDGIIVTPEQNNSIGVTPNSVSVGTLDSDASQEVSFSLKPTTTCETNISFTIQFKNGENIHTNTVEIPIEVIETLDVAPVFYGSTPLVPQGGSTRVRLEVYNAKTTQISGVIVTPITDVTMSPSQYFIGSMDPDDVFSVNFDVYSDGLALGNYTMAFQVSFKQNEEYYETPMISQSFKVVPPSEEGGDGGSGLLFAGGFLLLVVILLLWFFVIRRRKKT